MTCGTRAPESAAVDVMRLVAAGLVPAGMSTVRESQSEAVGHHLGGVGAVSDAYREPVDARLAARRADERACLSQTQASGQPAVHHFPPIRRALGGDQMCR